MPGRLGPRFAIEALFLIALAVAAAYADLASKWIVIVMAAGWLVVALLELSADRIWAAAPPWRRPYYVPVSPPRAETEAAPPKLEPLEPTSKRRWFRRRGHEPVAVEVAEIEMPKHVRLLPADERTDSDEVTELFDAPE